MSREKGCALFLVFAFTMAVGPDAIAQKKKKTRAPSAPATEPSLSGSPSASPSDSPPDSPPASTKTKGKGKGKKGSAAAAPSLTGGGGSEAVSRGDSFYDAKNYYMASIEYNKAIEDTNGDELSKQTAEFRMGKALYKLHFYSTSISYFDRIVQKGAAHPHYNETLQWLAALTRDVPDSAGVLEKIGKYDRAELDNPQLSAVRDELYFLLGKFNYTKNKFKEAVELFNMVNPKSPFYVQAKLFEGATHVRDYQAKPAVEAFKEVLRVAEESSDPKVRPFQDLANLSLARVFYSTGQFVLATKYFDRVSPDSYDWPNSLFESSWANFMLKQAGYSKALGNIHTLRAPFFEYFIKPESAAEALTVKATIYFYNCLFDRANDAMNEFDESVPEIKKGLEELLKKNQDNTQFFDAAVKIRSGRSGMKAIVERAARAVLTDRSLAKRFEYVRELDKELAAHDKADVGWKSTAVALNVFSDIGVNRALMLNEAGEMARTRIARLVSELTALINRVTKIKFEILEGEKSQEEEDLKTEQAHDRSHKAKNIVTINVDDEHQFWPFTGEYWRDELGYYRYKLANKCGRTGAPEGAPQEGAAPPEAGTEGTSGEGGASAPATSPAEGASPSPDTTPTEAGE
jgi:tetratricopeptide (TPR) repeat protein